MNAKTVRDFEEHNATVVTLLEMVKERLQAVLAIEYQVPDDFPSGLQTQEAHKQHVNMILEHITNHQLVHTTETDRVKAAFASIQQEETKGDEDFADELGRKEGGFKTLAEFRLAKKIGLFTKGEYTAHLKREREVEKVLKEEQKQQQSQSKKMKKERMEKGVEPEVKEMENELRQRFESYPSAQERVERPYTQPYEPQEYPTPHFSRENPFEPEYQPRDYPNPHVSKEMPFESPAPPPRASHPEYPSTKGSRENLYEEANPARMHVPRQEQHIPRQEYKEFTPSKPKEKTQKEMEEQRLLHLPYQTWQTYKQYRKEHHLDDDCDACLRYAKYLIEKTGLQLQVATKTGTEIQKRWKTLTLNFAPDKHSKFFAEFNAIYKFIVQELNSCRSTCQNVDF
jgi:hypothetical protein